MQILEFVLVILVLLVVVWYHFLIGVAVLLLLLIILISYQSVLGFTIAIVLICALLFLFVLITLIRWVWRGISNFFSSKDLPKDAAELVRLIKLTSVIKALLFSLFSFIDV